MRVLLAVLLVGIAGCGGGEHTSSSGVAVPPSPVKADNAEATAAKATSIDDLSDAELADFLKELTDEPTDVPSDQSGDDAVAALKKLGARIKQDDHGEVVEISIASAKITDADLVHLKGLMELQELNLGDAKVTDTGVADLQKALPNCKITK